MYLVEGKSEIFPLKRAFVQLQGNPDSQWQSEEVATATGTQQRLCLPISPIGALIFICNVIALTFTLKVLNMRAHPPKLRYYHWGMFSAFQLPYTLAKLHGVTDEEQACNPTGSLWWQSETPQGKSETLRGETHCLIPELFRRSCHFVPLLL